MTRILYGYSGEGSGHSTRTREMTRCLLANGHDVLLASYDRGYRNLVDEFDVIEIEGLTISSQDNRVSKLKTLTENIRRLPAGSRALQRLRDRFDSFQPQVVVTDFEPLTAYLSEYYRLPLITIDNQQRMRYVDYQVPDGCESEATLTRRLIRLVVPWPSVSLVTAFLAGRVRNERTFLFPPIVSHEVRSQTPSNQGHLLVYLTSGFDSLIPLLKRYSREKFIVYGYDRDQREDNVQFKKRSRSGFLDDLASSQAVIATAGFTLISEALYLSKPYLAMPMEGQYEQELNAFQLQQSGYGASMSTLIDTGIGEFLYRQPEYRQRLATYDRDPGTAIQQKLMQLVADGGALAVDYRRRREQSDGVRERAGESKTCER